MAYPHSKKETLADAAVHAAGLFVVLPACLALVFHAAEVSRNIWAITLYAGCAALSFTASAAYHMSPIDNLRPLLRRIDHAAIYLKIAGTYTPIVMVLGSGLAYGVLGLVWLLAFIGVIAKMWFWQAVAKASLALYLGMGWLSALLIWPMCNSLPNAAVLLIILGGLVYSAGTRVYAHPGMRFQNAIWHILVLFASACLFGAIALSL